MNGEYQNRCGHCGGEHSISACPMLTESGHESHEKEAVEVSPDFLRGVFSGQDFSSRLKLASAKAKKSRLESGFEILKDPFSNKLWFGKVVGSANNDQVDLLASTSAIQRRLEDSDKPHYPFSSLHFHQHSESNPIITPSGTEEGDLYKTNIARHHIFGNYGFHLPAVEMIAVNEQAGAIKILAYREPAHFNPKNLTNGYSQMEDTLDSAASQEEVMQAFRQMQYIAEILSANSEGELDSESLQKLSRFAFKPKKGM